jgi:ferric-dicitrate binding protein FerR (iron transport regulator)
MATKNNPDFEILLNKLLDGKSTYSEKQQLYDIFAESENESSIKEILFRHLTEYNEDHPNHEIVDFDGIYGNILQEIKQNENHEVGRVNVTKVPKLKMLLVYGLGIAAMVMIAFFLGTLLPRTNKNSLQESEIAINYNQINVPLGSKSEITLPDGTRVMLNAGSMLKYRSDFNLKNRDIYLIGEAYFKVAKNLNLPLYVSAGNIRIKAVGTEFNVKAYDEEGVIETTLIEGKVYITQIVKSEGENQPIDLIPNQKAIYFNKSDSFTLQKIKSIDTLLAETANRITENLMISQKVDVTQVVAWTEGKLIIRGENLDNLCIELQRKYDVNFIFKNDEIKKYRFSGILLDETLEQILDVIKRTSPINYYLEGKTVFLNSDNDQVKNYSKHLK